MNPKQRPRGRSNNGGGNGNRSHDNRSHDNRSHGGSRHINVRTQVFDSNGPEGRIRGNAHQVMEKYLAMARDAHAQGDRVAAENFFQHAEHYLRLINAYNQAQGPRRPPMPMNGEQPAEGGEAVAYEGQEQQPAQEQPAYAEHYQPQEQQDHGDRDDGPVEAVNA